MRASFFAQNFSEDFLAESVAAGEFAFPAGVVPEPFIDADDIADVAVEALTEDGHAGLVHEITGPRLLTFAEAAAEISAALGRPVRYVPVTAAEFAGGLAEAGVAEDFARTLSELLAEVLDGRNESVTDGVRRVLGRPPRDFTDFARVPGPETEARVESRVSTDAHHAGCGHRGDMTTTTTTLTRSRDNRVIAGVCAGLAHRLGWKPRTMRWLFVLSCLLPGPQFLVYLVLWVIMPNEKH